MFDDPGENLGPKSNDLWKPVIAAVNGIACGGAFYMLGEVDFIIAAEHATFFDPHLTFNMAASFEPLQMTGRMPFGDLVRMTLLGSEERMSAERALQIGLVTEVVAGGELRERAAWAAGVIAKAHPVAVQGTLRALWAGRELSRAQALGLGWAFVGLGNDPRPWPRARPASPRASGWSGACAERSGLQEPHHERPEGAGPVRGGVLPPVTSGRRSARHRRGGRTRVVAEPPDPRRSPAIVPSTTPWATTSRPPGKLATATVRKRARRAGGPEAPATASSVRSLATLSS